MKKTIKNPNKPKVSVHTSVTNIFYNFIIFSLILVIVYLSYSAYLKLANTSKNLKYVNNKETAAEIIQLDVLNGCGVSGVADRFTD